MFEHYTERARRCIFFARYEASQFGSHTIETGHLLLGVLREDKNLLNRFLRPDGIRPEGIRKELEGQMEIRDKVSTSIDVPLSQECKRILAYAHEESQRLGHRFIGTEHLLLGMLRETGSVASRVLEKFGVEIERVREQLAVEPATNEPVSQYGSPPPADRAAVHALVDKLSEDALGWVTMVLERVCAWPPERPSSLSSHAGSAHAQRDTAGKVQEGRSTSSRHEDGALVVETQHFHHGHQVSITERLRLSEDGKKLFYSYNIVGPKVEQQHKHSMEFDLP